jgi:hypothetical protein
LFPGLWLWSVYPYHLNPYRFYNESARENQTLPVTCLCQEFSVCGCDNSDNATYLHSAIGNGRETMNKTLLHVADVNDTRTLVINGTLPNGTTAPGGTEGAAARQRVSTYSGYWVMVMIVVSIVCF